MKKKSEREPQDVNTNAHRIFGELIERSEQPSNRRGLAVVPSKAHGVKHESPKGTGVKLPVNRSGGVKLKPRKKAR
jgi:hypothetical protein